MRLLTLMFTTLTLTLSALAHAGPDNRLDQILARGSVRVATTGDYKPFSYRNRSGDYEGSDIELAGALAKALGVKLELIATSWPTLMKDLADDKFDIAMSGVSVSLERQKVALFSIPSMRDGKTPITRCENQARFQTLVQIDRPEVRLVVNPGGTNERFARANARHAQILLHRDNVTIFDEIIEGRADLMLTDAIETELQQKLHPQLCAVHPGTPFDFSEKAYLLPPDLLWKAWVDQWLHQTIESGSYQRTQDKWLAWPWNADSAQSSLDQLLKLMDQRLKLMPDVARYKWNTKSAIEDLPREKIVIDALAATASQAGVPAGWAERFFRAQIDASKSIQRALFAQWEQETADRFENVPDLAHTLRPQIDALTPKLMQALIDNWATLHNPARQTEVQAAAKLHLSEPLGGAATQAATPLTDGSATL